jgi:DNA polymerase V
MCVQTKVLGRIADLLTDIQIPFYETLVPAGFPSPALDYRQEQIDLNEIIIRDRDATFLVQVFGDSMIGAFIPDKSIVVVDRSIIPIKETIIVAEAVDGFTVKYYVPHNGKIYLKAANPAYPDIEINESHNFRIWGVVIRVLTQPLNLYRC